MTRLPLTTLIILLSSLCLLGAGAYGTYRELAPYFLAGISDESKFAAISTREYQPGASSWSKQLVLKDCRAVSRGIYSKAQTTRRRDAFLTVCRNLADTIAAEMQSHSEAFALAAELSAELGDSSTFNADLKRAAQLAPKVHWLAGERVELAERYYDTLDDKTKAVHRRDLRVLLDSDAGARLVAERFVLMPDLRGLITDVAETSPPDLQERFLGYVSELTAAAAR